MRRKACHSHILTKKTRARKRRLRGEDTVSKAEQKRIRTFLQAKARG
jgi:ribosomal protein L35